MILSIFRKMNEENILLVKKRDFIYLLNKCTMLYIHLDKDTKRDVLSNIQDFILKLQDTFTSNEELRSLDQDTKKERILSTLIPYLQKLTTNFMIEHITVDDQKKEFLMKEIDISSHSYARKLIQEASKEEIKVKEEEVNKKEIKDKESMDLKIKEEVKEDEKYDIEGKKSELFKVQLKEQISTVTNKITNHLDDKIIKLQDELNRFFQTKFQFLNEELHKSKEQMVKSIYNHQSNVESHLSNETNQYQERLQEISAKIKYEIEQYIIQKNESYVIENYGKVRDEIRDKVMYDLESTIKSEISQKIEKLTHILNKNLEASLKSATQLSQDEIQEFVSKKIEEYEYLIKNTPYILQYHKSTNTIELINNNKVLSSISLPLIQGPPGAQGAVGPAGSTPQFKKLDITKDGYLSVIVQDDRGSYELKSSNKLPTQQVPVQVPMQMPISEKSVKEVVNVTKSIHDLHFDKSAVMRLDSNSENTLIILKSLSIGEHSHTLRPNSVAIGGATCFQENSLAIGNKSQTLSKNSIAMYGSTSGENAFAYHSKNVPSNQFIVGEKSEEDKSLYNIQKIVLNADHIHLNSNHIMIRAYDEKIKQLEAKIATLEKHIQQDHQDEKEKSGFRSIFQTPFVQEKFFT